MQAANWSSAAALVVLANGEEPRDFCSQSSLSLEKLSKGDVHRLRATWELWWDAKPRNQSQPVSWVERMARRLSKGVSQIFLFSKTAIGTYWHGNRRSSAPDNRITEHPVRIGTADAEWTAVIGFLDGTFTRPMTPADGTVIQPTGNAYHLPMATLGHWNKQGVHGRGVSVPG
jgi:hypothetical protein